MILAVARLILVFALLRIYTTLAQVDFNLPERFDLSYNDKDQTKQRPIMIHRAIFGSLERFFGILTENYAGS